MSFGTLIACMDGRALPPLVDWVRATHGVDHVDVITLPGADAALATAAAGGEGLVTAAMISADAHQSTVLAVAGHHDCAANPVDAATHRSQIRTAVAAVAARLPGLAITGLYVTERWQPQVVTERPA